jgi:hypothetical protein
MLGPNAKTVIVIDALPTIDMQTYRSVEAGNMSIWVRVIMLYQNIFGDMAEIRLTGRYGRTVESKGDPELRFMFPDFDVPHSRWGKDFIDMRRLNYIRTFDPRKELEKRIKIAPTCRGQRFSLLSQVVFRI